LDGRLGTTVVAGALNVGAVLIVADAIERPVA
jgi:hypothetical protein